MDLTDSTLPAGVEVSSRTPDRTRQWVWPILLATWFVILCCVPDPRPLGAPAWIVTILRKCTGIDAPAARLIATLALRTLGLALLGMLVSWTFAAERWDRRAFAAVTLAPLLAIASLWIDLGYFPIDLQIRLACFSTLTGAVAAIALRRRRITAAALVIGLCAFFAWITATGIRDELDTAARAVGRHVLDSAGEVPDGDAGQAKMIEIAFFYASTGTGEQDPVLANEAAILALSVILGEEKIARLARRDIDPNRLGEAAALRERISLSSRKDWSQHFWVSAGLTLLSDDDRSIAVGLSKELMDSTPGGSGFSFSDLAADAAGNAFTLAATRNVESARAMQARIRGGVRSEDFVPQLSDLPEGLSSDVLQERFGGIGGDETRKVVEEIRRRIAACPGLR
jgi:hypothetical protein